MASKKLPDTAETISLLQAKEEAHDVVTELLEKNIELQEIYNCLQPLLYSLSVKLYAEDDNTITLQKLVQDSVEWIDQGIIPVKYKELQ